MKLGSAAVGPSLLGIGGRCAWCLSGPSYCLDENPDDCADEDQVEDHLNRYQRSCAVTGGHDVAEAHGGEDGDREVEAVAAGEPRQLKLAESAWDIRKYVVAKRSRNRGPVRDSASMALTTG